MYTGLPALALASLSILLLGTPAPALAAVQPPAQSPAAVVAPVSGSAIPAPIMLYPNGAPGALGTAEADKPRLYVFLPPNPSTNASVLVIPGGGYSHVALGHEGIQYAQWLNAQGIAAFVLDYRVAPYKFPVEIADGIAAMRYIRGHATEMHIDPDRIGVWGSSAGGHLAATLATECKLGSGPGDTVSEVLCQPNFVILSYPVISMEPPLVHMGSQTSLLGPSPDPAIMHQLSPQFAVSSSTGPTFIFATTGDPVVPVGNSVAFYSALQQAGVPVEMHLFDYANHGCGMCGDIPELSGWPMLLRTWLIHRNLLPATAPLPPPPGPGMQDWPTGLDGPGH